MGQRCGGSIVCTSFLLEKAVYGATMISGAQAGECGAPRLAALLALGWATDIVPTILGLAGVARR